MKKIIASLFLFMLCSFSYAQSNITLELKDAPIRTSLEMLFKQAGVKNYVIDNSVAGFVTLNLNDQPFENSLKIIMRAASVPLTYIKENDVYIVKQRTVTPPQQTTSPDLTIDKSKQNSVSFEVIKLNHLDPYDLINVLGNILFIYQFQRYNN